MNQCSRGSGGGRALPEHDSKCGVAGLAITRAAGASAGEEVCSHGRVVDGHVDECVEGLGVL